MAKKDICHEYFVFCKALCQNIVYGSLELVCELCRTPYENFAEKVNTYHSLLACLKQCHCHFCNGPIAVKFTCCKHVDEECVFLENVHTNTPQVPCIVCDTVSDCVVLFPCECKHCICLDYCITQLDARHFRYIEEIGYSICCPVRGCENFYITDPHHFRLMGDEKYEQYQKLATEACMVMLGAVHCPNPNCGAGIEFPPHERRIHCSGFGGCDHVFCKCCRESYHNGPCPGEIYEVTASTRAQWDRASENTILRNTKNCPNPKCKVATEHAGGCMHMVCSRCKYEWCWHCLTAWSHNCMSNHWFGI